MIDAYHVYLSASVVLVRRQTGFWRWRRIEELARWQWDAGVPASLDFGALPLRARRHATLSVYAGSALGKFMALDLPAGLSGEHEERAAAQAQMQHQLGLNPAQWEFTLDRVPAPGKSVACALRADVVARVRQLARERGLRLLSIRPFVAGVWNAVQRRRTPAAAASGASALMAVESDAYTIVIENDGVLESMSALSHRREADVVNRELRRMAYAPGADAQRQIRLAVSGDSVGLALAHADKIVARGDYLRHALYADFRDLLFQDTVQVAP